MWKYNKVCNSMQGPWTKNLVCDVGTEWYLLSPILCRLLDLLYEHNTNEEIQTYVSLLWKLHAFFSTMAVLRQEYSRLVLA